MYSNLAPDSHLSHAGCHKRPPRSPNARTSDPSQPCQDSSHVQSLIIKQLMSKYFVLRYFSCREQFKSHLLFRVIGKGRVQIIKMET